MSEYCQNCAKIAEERDALKNALCDVEYDLDALRFHQLKITELSLRTQAAIKTALAPPA